MKPCVLDASVVAAAFLQEEHAKRARALLVSGREMHAPDLVYAELANVIWKRCGRGEIDEEEAGRLLGDLLRLPLEITSCGDLAEPALQLALGTGRTVYDCLYLALAVKTKTVLISADRRLVNALASTPLAEHVAWIGGTR
jgi:predicted nucleic acid-binding protein